MSGNPGKKEKYDDENERKAEKCRRKVEPYVP